MKKKEIQERMEKLSALIFYHQEKYHKDDAPEISDEAYDALLKELHYLEKKYPLYKKEMSPSERIGGNIIKKFKKVTHAFKQWSFDKVFSEEEFLLWQERTLRFLEKKGFSLKTLPLCCEPKIDGLKIVLTYKKGKLLCIATRGNGSIGEDVTHTARTISSLRENLLFPVSISVVGEAWLPKNELERINKEREENNLLLFANCRNAAAGSLRHLDSHITKKRKLEAFVYTIDYFNPENTPLSPPKTQRESLALLKKIGFPVHQKEESAENFKEVEGIYKKLQKERENLPYSVDGLVCKVNEKKLQEELGYTASSPRYAVAYKFPAEEATTRILDITLQLGRTGVLTPVALLSPLLLDGSKVSRATLHNSDQIERLDIRIGDTVIIRKAGDIIPEIISVLPELRNGKEKKFIFPKTTSLCGGDGSVYKREGEVAYRCKEEGSFFQKKRELEHFVSKKAFNVEGLGKKVIGHLFDKGFVQNGVDIFSLKEEDLSHLPLFKEKAIRNLLASIEKSRDISLSAFLFSLSIPFVGEETARDIAFAIKKPENFLEFSKDDFEKIDGIGEKVAQSIVSWREKKENKKIFHSLLKEVKIKENKKTKIKKTFLTGKKCIITGTLENYSRIYAENLLRKSGAIVQKALSRNTDILIVGKNAGSKLKKAEEWGIKIEGEEILKKVE